MGMTRGSPTGNMNAKAGVEAKNFPYIGKNRPSFIYTENLKATTSEENVAPTFSLTSGKVNSGRKEDAKGKGMLNKLKSRGGMVDSHRSRPSFHFRNHRNSAKRKSSSSDCFFISAIRKTTTWVLLQLYRKLIHLRRNSVNIRQVSQWT